MSADLHILIVIIPNRGKDIFNIRGGRFMQFVKSDRRRELMLQLLCKSIYLTTPLCSRSSMRLVFKPNDHCQHRRIAIVDRTPRQDTLCWNSYVWSLQPKYASSCTVESLIKSCPPFICQPRPFGGSFPLLPTPASPFIVDVLFTAARSFRLLLSRSFSLNWLTRPKATSCTKTITIV